MRLDSFMCLPCQKMFNLKAELSDHISNVHGHAAHSEDVFQRRVPDMFVVQADGNPSDLNTDAKSNLGINSANKNKTMKYEPSNNLGDLKDDYVDARFHLKATSAIKMEPIECMLSNDLDNPIEDLDDGDVDAQSYDQTNASESSNPGDHMDDPANNSMDEHSDNEEYLSDYEPKQRRRTGSTRKKPVSPKNVSNRVTREGPKIYKGSMLDQDIYDEGADDHHIHDGTLYWCPLCEKKFTGVTSLKHHKTKRQHLKLNGCKFKCKQCVTYFLNNEDLVKHLDATVDGETGPPKCDLSEKSTDNLLAVCLVCSTKFSDLQVVRSHTKEQCAKTCPFCRTIFTSPDDVRGHVSVHYCRYRYRSPTAPCTTCKKVCIYLTEVADGDKSKYQLSCPKCDYVTIHSDFLHMHIANQHEQWKITCDECGKMVGTKACLRQHKNRYHNPFASCRRCRKTFGRYYLKEHLKYCYKTQRHLCNICGGNYPSKSALRSHKQHKHELKSYCHVCKICNKKFPMKRILSAHMSIHKRGDVKPFRCDICSKTFVTEGTLRTHHINVHSDVRPFTCSECPKAFKQKAPLERHIDSVHRNIRPYACELCDIKFKALHHLTNHMLKHTGERAFVCKVCGKAFQRQQILDVHMRTHANSPVS